MPSVIFPWSSAERPKQASLHVVMPWAKGSSTSAPEPKPVRSFQAEASEEVTSRAGLGLPLEALLAQNRAHELVEAQAATATTQEACPDKGVSWYWWLAGGLAVGFGAHLAWMKWGQKGGSARMSNPVQPDLERAQIDIASRDELERLARSGDELVRVAVAENASTPEDILDQLAKDISWTVRASVAENPNARGTTLMALSKDRSMTVRSKVAGNQSVLRSTLEVLAKDKDWEVRATVPTSPVRASDHVLMALANDESLVPRMSMAQSIHASARLLDHLANDKDADVRAYAIENKNVATDTIWRLVKDPSARVQRIAKGLLFQRGFLADKSRPDSPPVVEWAEAGPDDVQPFPEEMVFDHFPDDAFERYAMVLRLSEVAAESLHKGNEQGFKDARSIVFHAYDLMPPDYFAVFWDRLVTMMRGTEGISLSGLLRQTKKGQQILLDLDLIKKGDKNTESVLGETVTVLTGEGLDNVDFPEHFKTRYALWAATTSRAQGAKHESQDARLNYQRNLLLWAAAKAPVDWLGFYLEGTFHHLMDRLDPRERKEFLNMVNSDPKLRSIAMTVQSMRNMAHGVRYRN